jgi:hypothetical protein
VKTVTLTLSGEYVEMKHVSRGAGRLAVARDPYSSYSADMHLRTDVRT